MCQLIRTLLQSALGLETGSYDIAGILYFITNIPILLLAYKTLGRELVVKTIVCAVSYSFFYSIIPIPSTPIIDDYLTACMLGGILTGVGSGIVLTCGASGGGLDIVGLCLSKRGSTFTVGKFSLTFNVFLYTAFLVLFSPQVAIYSVIYNFFTAMVLDRVHQQNINVQALIFTREDEQALADFIIQKLGRSVTYWNGIGAYTKDDVRVLCVCLSKYEIEELLPMVHSIEPPCVPDRAGGGAGVRQLPAKAGVNTEEMTEGGIRDGRTHCRAGRDPGGHPDGRGVSHGPRTSGTGLSGL